MSDVLSDSANSGATKIRLLTFDWLPFTDDLSASETLFDAMDVLSAESVFFESHYIQQQGAGGIGLPPDVDGRFFLVSDAAEQPDAEMSAFERLLPALECESVLLPEGPSGGFDDLLRRTKDDSFCWLHYGAKGIGGAAESFSAALPLIQAFCDQDAMVLVTSLNGRDGDVSRFESTLSESLIHAPLWLLGGGEPARVQSLTGSRDVGYTIGELLQVTCVGHSAIGSIAGQALICLKGIADRPGHCDERTLLIEMQGRLAVRSQDFLLVCGHEPGGYRDVVLYAKPEDVWNVNNVAAEYQAIVEKLSQYLT